MKKITLIIISIFISISACKKKDKVDPSTEETTVEQDKQNIDAAFDQLSTCLTQMRDGEGAQAIFNFMDLDNGDVLNEVWIKDIIQELDTILDLDDVSNGSNRFDFSANAGTYTWNHTTEDWDKTSTPSDKIILHFPSTDNSSTNNSILTISSYDDESVTIDGESYFLPTACTANLLVDGEELFSVNFTAAYDAPIPINVSVAVMVKPYTYTITGNRVTPTKFSASINITNGSGCTTSGSVDFEFTHSDYETIDMSSDLKTVTATVRHNSLKIVSVIDALTLNAIEDPSETQINQYVKTNVYINDVKVGELQTYEDVNTDTRVKIIYKDGSEEDTEVYYQPFLESLEDILAPYGGDVDII